MATYTYLTRDLKLRQAQWVMGMNVSRPKPDEVKWGHTGTKTPPQLTNPDVLVTLVNEVAATTDIEAFLDGDSVAVRSTLENTQETGYLVINEIGLLSEGVLIAYATFREIHLEPGDKYSFTFNLLGGGYNA